jgi:hypothetical protein
MVVRSFVCLFVLLVHSCSDKTAPPQAQQQIYYEVESVNYAYGYQHHGYYIDQRGGVHSYSFAGTGEMWRDSASRSFSEQTLMKKFSHHDSLLVMADRDSVLWSYDLLKEAMTGTTTDTIKAGADRGSVSYNVYVFDPGVGMYQRVTLREEGDWSFHNQSPGAIQLVEWLKKTVRGN